MNQHIHGVDNCHRETTKTLSIPIKYFLEASHGISLKVKSYIFETFCAIWCYLYNLKSVKNTHGGVLLLVKLQALA